MAWIIFAVILLIGLFAGIGFIPQTRTLVISADGYFDTEDGEFVAGTDQPTRGRNWTFVKAGTRKSYTTQGWHLRPAQVLSLLSLVLILFGMIKSVPANNVGILFNTLEGTYETVNEGIKFRSPWVKKYKISTMQQELTFEEFSVQTSGSEFAWFNVEIKYEVNRVNAFQVFKNFQGLPEPSMVRQDVQNAVKTAAEAYNIYAILGDEYAELKDDAEGLLRIKLESYGIDLITLNFIDVDSGAAIEAKITERGLAQQQQEIEEQLYQAALIAQQKEQVEAETARIVKQEQSDATLYQQQRSADAAAYLITAQADADLYQAQQEALGIIALGLADAEAYAVVITAFGSIEAYNQYIHFMQWDGTVPTIVMGESGVLPIWEMGDVIADAVDPADPVDPVTP